MKGSVTALYRFTEKGKPGEPLREAHFLENQGMEGDRHASGGEKQLTLLTQTGKDWMQAQETKGLCFSRYKANLETEGLDVSLLRAGMQLQAGTAVFTVSERRKECFPGCPLAENGISCKLLKNGLYLQVVKSGTVTIGDTLVIL